MQNNFEKIVKNTVKKYIPDISFVLNILPVLINADPGICLKPYAKFYLFF